MRINQNNGGSGGGGGGGVQLGGAQVGFTPGMIQYITAAGTQGGDVLAIRSDVTNYTDILKDFSASEQGGFKITADVTGGLIANAIPGSFTVSQDTVKNLYAVSGAGDIGGFLGIAPGTATDSTVMAVYNPVTSDVATTKVWYYDGSIGGTATFRHETDVINGNILSGFLADYQGFSAYANDVGTSTQSTSALTPIAAEMRTTDTITNFDAGFFASLTGLQALVTPVFTGTKDWTLALLDDIGSDNVSLSFTNITDNDRFLLLNPATGNYIFGDENGAVGGTYLHMDETAQAGGLTDIWTTSFHVQSQLPTNQPLIYIDSIVGHTRLGYSAGGNSSLLAGAQNTYVGYEAGFGAAGSLGQGNTCIGYRAGYALATNGDQNTLVGNTAGDSITTGQNNDCYGYGAGAALTTQSNNALFGSITGGILTGTSNAMFGVNAGGLSTTADHNVFVGATAGLTNTTGDSNVMIGSAADMNAGTYSASIGIGRAVSITASNQLKFGSATYPVYQAYIGDYTAAQNGLHIAIDDTAETIKIGDVGGTNFNTLITLDDTTGGRNIVLAATNLTQISSGRIFLNGSQQVKRTAVNDAGYTILGTDYLISMENLTASRTVVVPDASTFFAGRTFIIKDADGLAATWNIVLDPAGTDTIDGAATMTMATNYQSVTLVSDGVSNWEVI